MSDFDPYAYAAASAAPSGATSASPSTFDPYTYAGVSKGAAQSTPQTQPSALEQGLQGGKDAALLIPRIYQGLVVKPSLEALGTIASGYRGLWDLALGRSGTQAATDVENTQKAATISPTSKVGKVASAVAESNYNPANWIGTAADKAGTFLGDTAADMGASPGVSTALKVAPTAALSVLPFLKGGLKAGAESADETGSNAGGFENEGTPPGAPPAEPEVTAADKSTRQDTLARVGIRDARQSAIDGDRKAAATDYQMSKYDQPAGRYAASLFDHERDSLSSHAEGIVNSTGGTLGMDEDALANRGVTIDKPFSDMGKYLDKQMNDVYAKAKATSDSLIAQGNPQGYTQLPSIQGMLNDPTFTNTLLARDQGGLLNAVRSQLQRFSQGNPNGFSAAGAEQFRQWLNQVWSPDNKFAIGKLKGAIDDDVTQMAGGDVYKQARAIRILKAQTLENPNGISDLFESDPQNSINRSTPYERIPDKLTRMDGDQFGNVIQTLKNMPDELQPQAQAALGEIKAHLANKLLQAGTQTRSGATRALWNSDAVNNVLTTNASKFRWAFGDDADALGDIKDLKDAGDILKVDASYPGADAQAANAMKRGLISRVAQGGLRLGGAVAGGVFGPLGAGAGEMAGSAAGEAVARTAAEKAALKAIQKRVVTLEPP